MKVSLNIENDTELRAYIKDAIKGQVLSFVRDEFLEIIKEELERKIKNTNGHQFERMMQECIKEAISGILYKEHNVKEWDNSFIQKHVSAKLDDVLSRRDWTGMVDKLANDKIKALLSKVE